MGPTEAAEGDAASRLNLLVSYGGWRERSWADQLPDVLHPLGIRSIRVHSGEEAEHVLRETPIHIAVVDLMIPLRQVKEDEAGEAQPSPEPAGMRVVQLLRRVRPAPPTVVVRPRQAVHRENVRSLGSALREGAFAVLDTPVALESMLRVMHRIVSRHYANAWPGYCHDHPDKDTRKRDH